jgi:dihydrofolate reductase
MIISLLVAMDENRGIGKDNRLPWHLSKDLKRFKALTMGHHIIMGRKTYDSIGRALPGRKTIVVTHNPDYQINTVNNQSGDICIVHSIDEAITFAADAGETEAFIIGGGTIFEQTLPLAGRIYLTRVLTHQECDTYFPELIPNEWEVQEEIYVPADGNNEHASKYQLLVRK